MQIFAVLVSALVATVLAGFLEGFPQCGITCINNMLGQAASLGCPDLDVACLCNNINFRYGIRDCAFEHCQDVDLANQVISFGNEECSSAGVPYPEPSATATLTLVIPSTTGTITVTGEESSAIVSATDFTTTYPTASVTSVPETTSPIVTTDVISGTTTIRTIGSSTIVPTPTTTAGVTTTTSFALAAAKTAAPAGLLVAAGIAAVFL